jgi:hypothetical protein
MFTIGFCSNKLPQHVASLTGLTFTGVACPEARRKEARRKEARSDQTAWF